MNTVLPISKVRKDIFNVTDAARDGAYVTITEHGEAKAVLMSAEEFDLWRETVKVMREFPNVARDLGAAKQAIKSGAYRDYPIFVPHGIPRPSRGARGKGTR